MKHYKSKEWLEQKYTKEQLTLQEMADLCGVTQRTVLNWMMKFEVPRRTTADALRGKYTGEKAFWTYGKKHSIATRQKISANHLDVSGKNNPMYGRSGSASPSYQRPKSHSERTKLSNALKGRKRPYMRGALNPFWKGGITPLAVAIRNLPKSIEWRQAVFQRDSFTCQDCGDARGHNLNAHHIVPLVELLRKFKITEAIQAVDCLPLWKIKNGITVCKKCHKRRHLTRPTTETAFPHALHDDAGS